MAKNGNTSKGGRSSRNILVMTYASAQQIEAVIQAHSSSVRGFAYIKHDKDEAEPHFHVMIKLYGAWSPKAIEKWFSDLVDSEGNEVNTFCETISDVNAVRQYLTHADKTSKEAGKHRYSLNEIVDHGLYLFDEKQESVDNTYQILCAMESGKSLRWLLRVYGKDFLYHYNHYKDLLADIKEQERNDSDLPF